MNQDDREVLQALDFPVELKCEQEFFAADGTKHVCSKPAQWLSVCKSCSDTFYVCNEHKVLQQRIPYFAAQHDYRAVGRA